MFCSRGCLHSYHFYLLFHHSFQLLKEYFFVKEKGFTEAEFDKLIKLMMPNQERRYGYTFSDVVQRFLPSLLLEAFPDKAITFEMAISVAKNIQPVKPFNYE